MLYSIFNELLSIILARLIESDDVSDAKVPEHLYVVLRVVAVFLIGSEPRQSLIDRPHKSDEFPWDNPIQISILHFLVIFILLRVKIFEAVPAELHCYLQPLEALNNL